MGTDSLRLFNKTLADSIIATGREPFSAFGDEEVRLDYWGCYAEVFVGHPDGSISSLDYLPDQEEETFLLLRPDHVGQIIKSLRDHLDDLIIMDSEKIDRVESWKEYCSTNSGYLVAYVFDF